MRSGSISPNKLHGIVTEIDILKAISIQLQKVCVQGVENLPIALINGISAAREPHYVQRS